LHTSGRAASGTQSPHGDLHPCRVLVVCTRPGALPSLSEGVDLRVPDHPAPTNRPTGTRPLGEAGRGEGGVS
jgi:hypothetical protein